MYIHLYQIKKSGLYNTVRHTKTCCFSGFPLILKDVVAEKKVNEL